jgi:hypothetical protein
LIIEGEKMRERERERDGRDRLVVFIKKKFRHQNLKKLPFKYGFSGSKYFLTRKR